MDRWTIDLMDNNRVLRGGLLLLGIPNLLNGVYALTAPRSWFDTFGVGGLGGFNDHLVRDVGEAFIATSLLVLWAAIVLSRPIIYAALGTWLVFNVPHFVNHLVERDSTTLDAYIGAIVALGVNVGLAVLLLVITRKQPAS